MSELEDKISNLMNNPGEMSKLMAMARSIMEGGESSPEDAGEKGDAVGGLDPMITKLISGFSRHKDQKSSTSMLRAISPYLDEQRGKKLERAIRLAGMAKVATQVFRESGGDGFGDK